VPPGQDPDRTPPGRLEDSPAATPVRPGQPVVPERTDGSVIVVPIPDRTPARPLPPGQARQDGDAVPGKGAPGTEQAASKIGAALETRPGPPLGVPAQPARPEPRPLLVQDPTAPLPPPEPAADMPEFEADPPPDGE
jgi:hypothetical protein